MTSIILSWALIIKSTSYGGNSIIYFESRELCENAKQIINETSGNGTNAITPCLQIRK
jgi:hypothetical protein